MEQGKTVSQNILTDWTDPDGDDLVLMSATADNEQDQVKVRRDGLLTFQDSGATAGKKNVTVTVWDGRATTTGKVVVNVQPPGALAPVVNADHVTAVVGQDLVIAPLKNDVDPNGGALRLAQVEASGPAELGPVTDGGTFTFRSRTPGPVYLTYIASNGPQSSQGLIRVDVESGKDTGNPVAVHDVALLPIGGSVLLDPLANDSDPSGGVLVLQSVQLPENATASVSVIDHSVLRITDVARHQGPLPLPVHHVQRQDVRHRQRLGGAGSGPAPSWRRRSPNRMKSTSASTTSSPSPCWTTTPTRRAKS